MDEVHIITRRSLLRDLAPATAAAVMVGLAVPPVEAAPSITHDPDLCGLPLAALYAEKVAEAMAHPLVWGDWSITIHSGDADQMISFQQMIAYRHDPLLDAIKAYRDGLDDFNRNSSNDDEAADAYVDVSYGPPMKALEQWDKPARTAHGALAALELIEEESRVFVLGDLHQNLLRAALGYLRANVGVL